MTLRSELRRFRQGEAGMAAAEFALILPVLVLMLLGSVDLSRMIQERIALAGVLRAGAEAAFREQSKSQIEAAMRAASDLKIGMDNSPYNVVPVADQSCACPATPSVLFSCVDRTNLAYPCGSTVPAYVYWRMSVSKTVATVFLPERTFNKSITVQIR
ncbi:MAG: hypothetical protein RIT14_2473 [Pseudomonadota bacterium]|jgi:Flp pilus assembly protein TadG